jgi:hypothetical protein
MQRLKNQRVIYFTMMKLLRSIAYHRFFTLSSRCSRNLPPWLVILSTDQSKEIVMASVQSTPTQSPADLPIFVRDRRRKGFFTIENALFDQYGAQLKAHGLAVYIALARFVNQDGACWPSLSTIANRTGMSRMQVIREIGKLQELGLIAVEHQCGEKGEHRSNLYILLNVPEVVTDSDWGSNTQLLGVVTHSDHPSHCVLPEQHPENKTQLENKTQRTTQPSRAPINNNSGGQLAFTSVVVASPASLQEVSSVMPKRNRKGKRSADTLSGLESPIPLDPPSPSASPTEQALLALGIGQAVAHRLALRYQAERIQEKLTYLAFLQAERPESVQNPRGWLRKAIEEDYGPPDGFITAEERAHLAAEATAQAQRAAAAERQHQALVAERQTQQEAQRRTWQERYGTTEADNQLWSDVLTLFRASRPDLYHVYAQAQILRCTEEVVLLGFEQQRAMQRLEHPGTRKALQRQLQLIAKRPLEVETALLPVAETGYPEEEGAGSQHML